MDVQIECICPPKDGQPRHEQDTVTLPEVLDFRTTLIVRQEIRQAGRVASEAKEVLSLSEMTATMSEAYLLHCLGSWTCERDSDKGKPEPLPLTKTNITEHLLANYEMAERVADECDELYSEKVVLPLLQRASNSSGDTSTGTPTEETSPTNGGNGSMPRKPSKRSSTSTTPMEGTERMAASPAGGSSVSLS